MSQASSEAAVAAIAGEPEGAPPLAAVHPDPVRDLDAAYRELRTRARSLIGLDVDLDDVEKVRGWLQVVHRFLLQDLLPFVSAEQLRLYPAVHRWTGVRASSFTHDHARMARLADNVALVRQQLAGESADAARSVGAPKLAFVRSIALQLRMLVDAHLDREGPAVMAAIAAARQRGEAERLASAMLRTASVAREVARRGNVDLGSLDGAPTDPTV